MPNPKGTVLHDEVELLHYKAMKFAMAILVFLLFAFFISWGIVLLLAGNPWLLIAALVVFFGTFATYGCHAH